MTKVTIKYDDEEVQRIVNAVKKYNKTPQDSREDISDAINRLSGMGIVVAREDDTTEEEDENFTEYILTVVPAWCRDFDTYDSADKSYIQEMFDDYCDDLGDEDKKTKDCWHSDLDVTVLEHCWSDNTSAVHTLEDFAKYMSDCLRSDFADNL